MTNTTTLLAWRNIWRHPRRTLLTIAAMVFADVLLIFMLGLQLGQYRMMIDNSLAIFTGQMQVQADGYNDEPYMYRTIPAADALAEDIRARTQLEAVATRGYGFALVSSETRTLGAQISGVDPQFEPRVSTLPGLIKQGRYLDGKADNEIVIGSTLARNLRIEPGDELTILGSGRDGSMAATVTPVVGIYESGNRDMDRMMLSMPLDTFRDVFSMGDTAHSIVIGGERDRADRIATGAQAALTNKDSLVLLDWEALMPGLKQAIQADFTSAWFMYAVLIILVAFGMLNTMLMSVLERTHEFGILLEHCTLGDAFRVANGILRDHSHAEDATQQAYLDIWRNIRRLRDPAKFEVWSYPSPGTWLVLAFGVLLLAALYFARKPFHRAMSSLSRIIHNAMRLTATSVMSAEKKLVQRNREVLMAAGLEKAERLVEREFGRINTAVVRDLESFPHLQRQPW